MLPYHPILLIILGAEGKLLICFLLKLYHPSGFYSRSGDRIPVEARFSAPVQTGPEAHKPPVQWVPGLSWR